MSIASETNNPADGSVSPVSDQPNDNNTVPSVTEDEAAAFSPVATDPDARVLAEESSLAHVEDSNYNVSLNHASSSSSLEIISPRPSPHIPSKNFMSATVEDCFDDEDDDGRVQLNVADTPPSSFCVTTPPINEPPRSPAALEKKAEPHRCEDHMQEGKEASLPCHPGSPDITLPQNNHQRAPLRRPSVMDYLISQDSAKNSASTSEASRPTSRRSADGYPWSDLGRGVGQPRTNGQPNVFGLYHSDDRKMQPNWNDQQPPFRFPDNPASLQGEYGTDLSSRGAFTQPYEHGIPPTPRSNPSVPQNDLRSEQQPGNFYPEFTGRLETMAPSGYQLLAAKLSGDAGGQALAPIYRRFDSLNHRLLLYMQDEIADLERQLTTLEAKDTLKRSYPGGVLPASRRQDRWINPSLADQKTEVLGHIGYKLSQYNQVLASFRKVQDIPVPTWRDIHMYKTYLTTSKLIIDDETRFLDAANDLVSLAGPGQSVDDFNTMGDGPTPMPKPAEEPHFPAFFKDNTSSASPRPEQAMPQRPSDAIFVRLALSGMCIVFVPIMTFAVVPNFVSRMAIVLLVALSVGIMADQAGLLPDMQRHRLDWILYSGLYCGAMAVVAGAVK